MHTEALAEEEPHLPEGVPGSRRLQIRPEHIEEVFAAGAPAGECVEIDKERDRFPDAEHGNIGGGRVKPDTPQCAEHGGLVGWRNYVRVLHLTVR